MQEIKLDLSIKKIIDLVHAKQRDVGTKILVKLTDNKKECIIPDNVTWSVWYSGASGEGNYTEINGRSAVVVEGSTATVELIYQMLNNPGGGQMCLVMNGPDNTQLGLWNIPYFVEDIPGADSQAAIAYYQAFLNAQAKAEEAADRAEAAAERAESAGGGGSCVNATEKALILTLFRNAAYTSADMGNTLAQLEAMWSNSGDSGDSGETEVTLSSISVSYSGGNVAVGTSVTALTDLVVTAHYSDGSTAIVTGYTLSGTIIEGENTVVVSYGGKTTTFTVTGTAESGGGEIGNDPFAGTWVEDFRLQDNGAEYPTGHANYDTTDYVDVSGYRTIMITAITIENTKINAVVFYDGDKKLISGLGNGYVSLSGGTIPENKMYDIPSGTTYCRLCIVNYENVTITTN